MTYAYAFLLILLGLIGYLQAGSLISALSGATSGVLILLGAFFGSRLPVFVTGVLSVVFTIRSINTHKMIPIVMCVASFAMLYYYWASARLAKGKELSK